VILVAVKKKNSSGLRRGTVTVAWPVVFHSFFMFSFYFSIFLLLCCALFFFLSDSSVFSLSFLLTIFIFSSSFHEPCTWVGYIPFLIVNFFLFNKFLTPRG
jgi:hypothetical protein